MRKPKQEYAIIKSIEMKNSKVNLGGFKQMLTKDQQKKIFGGYDAPADPSGGTGSGQYKCCWTGTTNCSVCVACTASCTCVAGATLTAC